MAGQHYNTVTARINRSKGEILAHALPHMVLGITGSQKPHKKNDSDTVIFRRWLPYGGSTADANTINEWVVDANAHLTQEGVTPTADNITAQDISVQINQYSALYTYTDKAADIYEDDIPMAEKEQCGERMGLVKEMVSYGALKGITSKYYAGGSSRATVDESVSLNLLRKSTRGLLGNGAKMITKILDGSPNYNTAPIESSYLVFTHTDMEHDIRELPGFVKVAEYGTKKPVHENEVGSVDRYRFVVSKELKPYPDSGAAIGVTGLVSTTGVNIDVYPVVIVGQNCWANVALRGMDSFDVKHIPHTQISKDDPLGQRGYVGAIFWDAAFIQNDGWGAVIECGATEL